jgi:hypothetical protein
MMEVGQMALYEMMIVIGIAVVLVAAVIGSLVARVMMGPEELALLRQARETRADLGELKRRIGS